MNNDTHKFKVTKEEVDKAEAAYDLANNKSYQTASGTDKAAAAVTWDKYVKLKAAYEMGTKEAG